MRFLSGICLITEDVRRLVGFYEDVLRARAEDVNDVHVNLPVDGGVLTFYSKSAAQQDMGFHFAAHHGNGMIKFSFLVKSVDDEYEYLHSIAPPITFLAPPTTYPWGARSMHFRDPDGNIVCFVNG